MSIIRLAQHIDSDMLHLPELRPLIGKQVEITIGEPTSYENSYTLAKLGRFAGIGRREAP